jgi:hypothetical protein
MTNDYSPFDIQSPIGMVNVYDAVFTNEADALIAAAYVNQSQSRGEWAPLSLLSVPAELLRRSGSSIERTEKGVVISGDKLRKLIEEYPSK